MKNLNIGKINIFNKEEEALDYKVNNVVATVSIEILKRLNLVEIAQKLRDVEYNPEKFPGVIIRQEKPKSTFLLFSTGKMVVTGLESVKKADKAVSKIIKRLNKNEIKLNNPKTIIQNIVISGDLHYLIDLNRAVLLMDYAMYEPEIFPGLMYRMKDPGAAFLIFSTGKFVCTGIKTVDTAEEAILKLRQTISELDLVREKIIEERYEELTFI